jgi:hypothetical protein
VRHVVAAQRIGDWPMLPWMCPGSTRIVSRMITNAYSELPIARLIEILRQHSGWVPVRAMEALVRYGTAAVEPACEAVRGCTEANEAYPARWLAVVLGVLGDARAAPVLAQLLRTAAVTADVGTGLATSESIARLGAAVAPTLIAAAEATPRPERYWYYCAAARLHTDETYAFLVAELAVNRRMADVIALALADLGRREALSVLCSALPRIHAWQRGAFEVAIRSLNHGSPVLEPFTVDWRLRYRPVPGFGDCPPLWPCIASVIRSAADYRAVAGTPPAALPACEVLDMPPAVLPPERCDCCGEVMRNRTGIPTCARLAPGLARLQADVLLEIGRPTPPEDLFDILDVIDGVLFELHDPARNDPGSKGADWVEGCEHLHTGRAAAFWLIEQGIETTAAGAAALLAEAEAEAAIMERAQ